MSGNTRLRAVTVVTVDDSPLIAERMNSLLGDIENLRLLGNAFSISSAQDLIAVTRPDVVILDLQLDLNMLGRTGIDLLTELRQNYPHMKIIVFTNHSEPHYRDTCFEKGADYFLDKLDESHKISDILKQWTIRK